MLSLSDLPKCCEQVSCNVTWRPTLKDALSIWGDSITSPSDWKKTVWLNVSKGVVSRHRKLLSYMLASMP